MRSLFFPFQKIEKPTGVRYATFSSRCFAMTLDMLLLYVIIGPLLYKLSDWVFPELPVGKMMEQWQFVINGLLTNQLSPGEAWTITRESGMALKLVFDYSMQILVTGAAVIWAWQHWNTTPGLALLGSEIVDADSGGTPSLKQYVLRYLGLLLSLICLMIGMIWAVFDVRRQGWHDKLAHTVVLKKKSWLFGKAYAEEPKIKTEEPAGKIES